MHVVIKHKECSLKSLFVTIVTSEMGRLHLSFLTILIMVYAIPWPPLQLMCESLA